MSIHYTDEKNVQIVLGLLKAHNIKKVVVSPGATNITIVASMQNDPWFEMYSSVDERSAAYMACGLSAQTNEPVVLSCTGATASRNYFPGLTEAFYSKLPILAITSTQYNGRIGHNIPQVIDRSSPPKDSVKLTVDLPMCYNQEEEWACNINANKAILELTRNGGGPVHINLQTSYSGNYTVEDLPPAKPIFRFGKNDNLPQINGNKIAVFIGAHKYWNEQETKLLDEFCEKYNAVVFCDHTSNYYGKYRFLFSLLTSQDKYYSHAKSFDLVIHIGNISGAYPEISSAAEWRVNPDGEIRDTFRHLKYVFQMEEMDFLKYYTNLPCEREYNVHQIEECRSEDLQVRECLNDLPFSNIWIAKNTADKLPKNSILHLGILNTLRAWNFFEITPGTDVKSNTGGFGIDGILSTAVGSALGCKDKTVFCVMGDLAFFYDMNIMGNHNITNNLRILLINNGKGAEFRNYNHARARLGEDADKFVAAANHFGNKSKELVKHYAQDLGFEYITANNKEEYIGKLEIFVSPERRNTPLIFEVFTNSEDESKALYEVRNLKESTKEKIKTMAKNIMGEKGFNIVKGIIKG